MPTEFDPAWEYRVTDPEIEEVMTVPRRQEWFGDGMRFGRGNPDHCLFRFGPEKKKVVKEKVVRRYGCSHCDKAFTANRPHPYCSLKCAGLARRAPRLTKVCEWCKKSFQTLNEKRRFCEKACRTADMVENWNYTHKNNGGPRRIPDKTCPGCEKVFRPYRSSQVFCTKRCYKPRGAIRKLPETHVCEHKACGKSFRPMYSTSRFCSKVCSNSARRLTEFPSGCPGCGGPVPLRKGRKDAKRFCSDRCKNKVTRRNYWARHRERLNALQKRLKREKKLTSLVSGATASTVPRARPGARSRE